MVYILIPLNLHLYFINAPSQVYLKYTESNPTKLFRQNKSLLEIIGTKSCNSPFRTLSFGDLLRIFRMISNIDTRDGMGVKSRSRGIIKFLKTNRHVKKKNSMQIFKNVLRY